MLHGIFNIQWATQLPSCWAVVGQLAPNNWYSNLVHFYITFWGLVVVALDPPRIVFGT